MKRKTPFLDKYVRNTLRIYYPIVFSNLRAQMTQATFATGNMAEKLAESLNFSCRRCPHSAQLMVLMFGLNYDVRLKYLSPVTNISGAPRCHPKWSSVFGTVVR
jgi:hypothetical protein